MPEVIRTCRRLKRNQLRIRHKQDWGRDFIVYLPQAAVLPKSDADIDVVKHTVWSSKTVRTHALCSARYMGMLLEHGMEFIQRRCTCNLEKERDPICAWKNGIAHH